MIEPIDQKAAVGKRIRSIFGHIGSDDRVVIVFDDGTYLGIQSNREEWCQEHHDIYPYEFDVTDFSEEAFIRLECDFMTMEEIRQAKIEKRTADVVRQRERDFAELARIKQRLEIA